MKKLALSMALLLLCGAGTAWAQGTADGQTPANEDVCDGLMSATPGLYGLCIAFCEAQDCDFDQFDSGQCEPSDPVLLQRYDKLKQPGDPDMPCLEVECPCFDAETIQEVEAPFDICAIDVPIAGFLRSTIRSAESGDFASVTDRQPVIGDTCNIRFTEPDGGTIFRFFVIDEEEFALCKSIFLDWVDVNGGCPAP